MFDPVKDGFGRYMAAFYATVVANTRPLEEFVARGVAKSIMWAPGRMVDAAEEMLALYGRKNNGEPTKPFELPVMFVAMAKDYNPTGRDFTRQVADRMDVIIPGDERERVFGLRTAAADIRAQVVVAAMDEPTARSLAAQFALYLDSTDGRRFRARYEFAGELMEWPVVIEAPDVPAMLVQTETKNLTMFAADVTLRATVPLFDAPRPGQPNDEQGEPGAPDPAGYPVVRTVFGSEHPDPELREPAIGTWRVGE